METLRRNKRKLYLCKKTMVNGLNVYAEPVEMWENYQPTNTEGDLISIGITYPTYLRIKTNISEKDTFSSKDRLYIYVDKPTTYDKLCKNADYEVYQDPMIFLNEVEVILHRLSSDSDE